MDSKERAKFRAQAHSLTPAFQVGKYGVTEAVVKQTEEVLDAKELIKVKVLLESCPETPREVADRLAEKTGADVISVIGGVVTLYRYSYPLHEKAMKKAANIRRAKEAAAGNNYRGRLDKEKKWKK